MKASVVQILDYARDVFRGNRFKRFLCALVYIHLGVHMR